MYRRELRLFLFRVPENTELTGRLQLQIRGSVETANQLSAAFTYTRKLKVDSVVAALEEKDDALAELTDELLESYCPGHEEDPLAPLDMDSLRLTIWCLLLKSGMSPKTKTTRQRMAVLQVIDHICTLIVTNQLAPPTAEHVVVSAWPFILAVLLGGEVVRGIPGEVASPAAKNVRLHIENEYGVTTKFIRGRKVDLSFCVVANNHWNNEICVFEFKASSASDAVCSRQQRKVVRLNTAVLQDLEEKVAGKSTGCVAWIPSDQVKVKQFLESDSMQIFLKFAVSLSSAESVELGNDAKAGR
ncbi:hypothetical protein EC968_009447 [Mortierella alpina]|nr:hypothetical protein EC968_009447 [Mortierella alpina]